MKRCIFLMSFGLFLFALYSNAAPNPFNIKFPVAELGNCGSVDECKIYCDEPANIEACISFGEKQGLLSKEEAQEAKKFAKTVKKGDWPLPDCRSHEECGRKCNLPENRERCYNWAKEKGFVKGPEGRPDFRREHEPEISKEKAAAAVLEDGGPGGCGSFETCGQFCSDPSNQGVCFAYAEKHGLFPKEDMERMKKFINKPGPGGCRGQQCREYCENPEHQEECFQFAKENRLLPPEELERMEGFRAARENLGTFGGPGSCKSEEECHQYCSQPEHSRECIEFAHKAGFIHEEQAEEHFKKLERHSERFEEFKHKRQFEQGPPPAFHEGPGGCSSPEECIKYCSDPEHRSECAKFGPKEGGTPPGGTFRQAPPNPEFTRPPLHSPLPNEFRDQPPVDFDPAVKCSEHGGRWNGSFCEFPQQSPIQKPSPTPQLNSLLQSLVNFLHN